MGGPTALEAHDPGGEVYLADASGLVWKLAGGKPALNRPLQVPGRPIALAIDPRAGKLYVALDAGPRVVVLHSTTGQHIAVVALPDVPGMVRLDAGAGLLFVTLPGHETLLTVDLATLAVVRTTSSLAQVTGLGVDEETHLLYLTHLDGDVSVVDARSGEVVDRLHVTDVGLSGVDVARGLVFAINTPGRELLIVDPVSHQVTHRPLDQEPTAVAADPRTGLVYVLDQQAIRQLEPGRGDELGRVLLQPVVQAPYVAASAASQSDEAQLAVSPADGSVYAIRSGEYALSLVPPELFQQELR
jgi:DNA-binding beta-propeller fold protein YncE